jgi:hypothetical protein
MAAGADPSDEVSGPTDQDTRSEESHVSSD